MASKSLTLVKALLALAIAEQLYAADDHPFDATLREVDIKREAAMEECKTKNKNPMARIECIEDVQQEFKRKGTMRGTREYAKDNYNKLATTELEALRVKLMKQQENARAIRDFTRTRPRPPGELTQEDLGVELGAIEDELRKRGRAIDERNLEEWKRMGGQDQRR